MSQRNGSAMYAANFRSLGCMPSTPTALEQSIFNNS